MFFILKKKEICPAYISKINSSCEKQIILLMIPNYSLLRTITSKSNGDFYYLNCFHSFRTENKLKSHEKVCKKKDFCGTVLSTRKNNILEFNQYMKSVLGKSPTKRFVTGKFTPGKFPPIKHPLENPFPENSHPENSHLEYYHPFH